MPNIEYIWARTERMRVQVTSAYVLRDTNGWQITDAGRQFFKYIEVETGDAEGHPWHHRWSDRPVGKDHFWRKEDVRKGADR